MNVKTSRSSVIALAILGIAFAMFQFVPAALAAVEHPPDLALGRPATASSNGALARTVTDGIALPNKNWSTSWDPPQVPARPSWIAVDLGTQRNLDRIRIYYSIAAYDGIYDVWAPPRSMLIQVGADKNSFATVLVVASKSIPDHGACYEERQHEYQFPPNTKGRFLRLWFPDGGKMATMLDVVSISQVRVFGPRPKQAVAHTATLSGGFGQAVVDLNAPHISELRLREPSGSLAVRSLLAEQRRGLRLDERQKEREMSRRGAYSYVTDAGGNRFESVRSRVHQVALERRQDGTVSAVRFNNIRLMNVAGEAGPVVENWMLRAGEALTWEIHQAWQDDMAVSISGTPALYLAPFGGVGAYRDGRVNLRDSMVTSTLWYDPRRLLSSSHADYRTYPFPIVTEYLTHTIRVRDTWAIYKLFTNFHAASDLWLKASGGYLYRRGAIRADFNEVGSVAEITNAFQRRAGEKSTVRLDIRPVDKRASGEQLAISIPDPELQRGLTNLFASVLNGGLVSDQKRFNFGNGSEDSNYAGSSWMQAAALSVASGSPVPIAEHPYTADQAFRGYLSRILGTLDREGRIRFGVNAKGYLLDDNLHVVSAVRDYIVKTGDVKFALAAMPRLERMINFFTARIDPGTGLFRSPAGGAHWYYDGIPFSGYSTYYQAFLYRALIDLAELAEALDQTSKAVRLKSTAEKLARAINDVLWYPDAEGGARYADWIDKKGRRHAYFVDIAQYPLIALNIAPPDRARQMLDTADKRLGELARRFGHTRAASLSLLWPLSASRGDRCFGTYFYGGSLLASTYWEVVARARAGRVNGEWGAIRLLQNFARRFEETSFVAGNALDIRGNISTGGDEAYLSDMVVTPVALVHGILGIRPSWQALRASPALPAGWDTASARLMWKGTLYEVKIAPSGTNIAEVTSPGAAAGR